MEDLKSRDSEEAVSLPKREKNWKKEVFIAASWVTSLHERVTYSLCKHTHTQDSKSISVRTPSVTPELYLDLIHLIQFWAIKESFQAPKDRICFPKL